MPFNATADGNRIVSYITDRQVHWFGIEFNRLEATCKEHWREKNNSIKYTILCVFVEVKNPTKGRRISQTIFLLDLHRHYGIVCTVQLTLCPLYILCILILCFSDTAVMPVFLNPFLNVAHYFLSSRHTNVRGGNTAGDSGLHAQLVPSAVVISSCL
jgi:hypothetical protein